MKAFLVIVFLLLISALGWSQTHPADTGWAAVRKNAMQGMKLFPPLWILDNRMIDNSIAEKELKQVGADSILEISILKDSVANELYGAKGVIVVTTKGYARKQVAAALMKRAKGYAKYRRGHPNDNEICYVVDGKLVDGKPDEILKNLYDNLVQKTATVSLADKYKSNPAILCSIVVINTKKDE